MLMSVCWATVESGVAKLPTKSATRFSTFVELFDKTFMVRRLNWISLIPLPGEFRFDENWSR